MTNHLLYYDFKKREWEVEDILGNRINKVRNPKTSTYELKKEYLLKWKGFQNPSWEPEENLKNCKDLLRDYLGKINGMNKNDLDNDLIINEDEKYNQNKANDDFYKPDSSKNKFQEKNKYKVLEILGVKFPDKKSEGISYKVKYMIKRKKVIKMMKKDNFNIPDNLIVKFYEKYFGDCHKG